MDRYDIKVQQNASWEITVTVTDSNNTPMDLTNWTGKCQFRAAYGDSTVLATATVTVTDPTHGVLKVSMTPAQTALLVPTSNKAPLPVYDVLIGNQAGTTVYQILEGTVTVKAGVTVWS